MTARRIIVIGASASGISALKSVVAGLPGDLPAIVCVVVHVAPDSPGMMPRILANEGALAARYPDDAEELSPGRIYVAPPDHHLLVDPSGRSRLSRGAKENRFRPAIDPLFRSAAHAFGPRAIGVVLSGSLYDGAAGLWAVKHHGGVAVVQSPDDAVIPSMPLTALRYVEADHCAPARDIGPLLARLASVPITTPLPAGEARPMDVESQILLGETGAREEAWALGSSSPQACPECHGVLREIREGSLVRYRCHVGHAYTVDGLLTEVTREAARSLAKAQRAFEESARLLRDEAERALEAGDATTYERCLRKANSANGSADAVRALATAREPPRRETADEAR
jgi:two-component system chemotaxis response regulator CheB